MVELKKKLNGGIIIYSDDKFEISIFADNIKLEEFVKDPFFKVCVKENEGVIYFYFDRPKYVSLSNWSDDIIKEIDDILSDPNIWGKLVMEGFNDFTNLNYTFEKPDYTISERK